MNVGRKAETSYPSYNMPNTCVRIILFLSSYAPLLLILAVRNAAHQRMVALTLGGIAVASVLVLVAFLHSSQHLAADTLTIQSVTAKDGDAMSYIVTYIFPFLDVPLNEPAKAASLIIMFAVLGLLYVNSNMICTNPMLNMRGYHIYEVETIDGKVSALITRRSYLRVGSELPAIPLGDYVLLEKIR